MKNFLLKNLFLSICFLILNLHINALTVSIWSVDASCGYATGKARAYTNGGMAPFQYLWNNGMTTREVTNLAPGTYSVLVTDSLGATATDTIVLSNINRLSFAKGTHSPLGFDSSGSIFIYDNNGIPPYTITWCDGVVTIIDSANGGGRDSMCATIPIPGCNFDHLGTYYSFVITDATGCSTVVNNTSSPMTACGFAPPDPVISSDCNNSGNGSISEILDQVDSTFLVGGLPYEWSYYYYLRITLMDSVSQNIIQTIHLSSSPVHTYTFTGLSSGTYILDYDLLVGNQVYTDFRQLSVVIPGLQIVSLTMSNDTLFCNSSASDFQWFYNGNAIAGANDSFYVFQSLGNYTVEVSDQYGCTIVAGPMLVDGIAYEEKENLLLIYPNPGTEEMNLIVPTDMKKDATILKVFDVHGKLIYTSSNIEKIQTTSWAEGLYQIYLETGNKLIKSRWLKH